MKEKVAILGGGIGALASAYYLNKHAGDKYDITVYQMGWRLGGKLASGRNLEKHCRNEEHGLHMWLGYYENAFRFFRDVYRDWEKPGNYPFEKWHDVFAKKSDVFVARGTENGSLRFWRAIFPENDHEPGDPNPKMLLRVADIVDGLLDWILRVFKRVSFSYLPEALHSTLEDSLDNAGDAASQMFHFSDKVVDRFEDLLSVFRKSPLSSGSKKNRKKPGQRAPLTLRLLWMWGRLREVLDLWVKSVRNEPSSENGGEVTELLRFLEREFIKMFRKEISESESFYTAYVVLDYGTSIISGLLNPHYNLVKDWDVSRLNCFEYRDWLRMNGATSLTLRSSVVQNLYDVAFGYKEGDVTRPNLAAGVAIRVVLRILLTYKGAMSYTPRAGFGDCVITPIYKTLRQQGVHFEFFHKVSGLELSEDKKSIAGIQMKVQAKAKKEPYEPLVKVKVKDKKELLCWPSEPLWDQLEGGDKFRERNVNFESKWCPEPPVDMRVLSRDATREEDRFDKVILAIALGAFKPLNHETGICDELMEHNPRFRRFVESQELIPSISVQLWTDRTLEQMGGGKVSPAPMVCTPWNLPIWTEMTEVKEYEKFPEGQEPTSLFYLCGTVHVPEYRAPSHEYDTPDLIHERAYQEAKQWLGREAGCIWPDATYPRNPRSLDFDILYSDSDAKGEERLREQYIRINAEPTECCTGSHRNTVKYRLAPGDSGFSNLYMAGAWTKQGMNAECVEGAVMSARAAVGALIGEELAIPGEEFLHKSEENKLDHSKLSEMDAFLPWPNVQWWYWTGHLEDEDGSRYGFLVVFFIGNPAFFSGDLSRVLIPDTRKGQMTHAAITVLDAKAEETAFFEDSEHTFLVDTDNLGSEKHRFELVSRSGKVNAKGGGGKDELSFELHKDGQTMTLTLSVTEEKKPVIHYDGHRHDYVFGGDTWYYSRERMEVTGELVKEKNGEPEQKKTLKVRGSAWFDRQYGDLFFATINGWNWFSIQLDEGTEVMIFDFPDRERGAEHYGNISPPHGDTIFLGKEDYTLEVLDYWPQPPPPHQGDEPCRLEENVYPSRWKLTLHPPGSAPRVLWISPYVLQQEVEFLDFLKNWMRDMELEGLKYWEGACKVTDESDEEIGKAYVELVNFQKSCVLAN